MKEFKTFGVTVNPPFLTDQTVDNFVNLSETLCEGYTIITEKKEEQRHIHALWVTKKPTRSEIMYKAIVRKLGKDWEFPKVACKVKPAYNKDFRDNYMKKGDDTVVVADTWQSHMEDYYPGDITTRRNHATDGYMNKLEELWKEYMGQEIPSEKRGGNTDCFLSRMMFVERRIKTINDPRKARQIYVTLARYINKHEGPTGFDTAVMDFNC